MRNSISCVLALCLLLFSLSGCTRSAPPGETAALSEPSPRLNLLVSESKDPLFSLDFSPEDLNGNYSGELSFVDFSSVQIEIDGTFQELPQAIRTGQLTVESLLGMAQADAREGFCTFSYTSELGLSHFLYEYPQFDLEYTFDVFEKPDGTDYLIQSLGIYPDADAISHGYFEENEDGRLVSITREDWGLTLESVSLSSRGTTLECTQSGGQQLGVLAAESFRLIQETPEGWKVLQTAEHQAAVSLENVPLNMEGKTTLRIDWGDALGSLPAGEYVLTLRVNDLFDAGTVHPLMKDYTSSQSYDIPITIP